MNINEKYRIVQVDRLNLAIEEYSEGINPKTKESVFKWKTLGFYSRLEDALRGLSRHVEMDLVAVSGDLDDFRNKLKQVIEVTK